MKIKSVQFNNFRTYKDPTMFEIEDKSIILLYGNNGYGKTSFFDGIEWGITGEISRYSKNAREKNDYPILTNYFNNSLKGSVEIKFSDNIAIKRMTTSKKSKGINKGELIGSLENLLIENTFESEQKFEKQFILSHLLCQETINSFVRETDEKKRYENFLSLYGFNETDGYKDKIKLDISEINNLLSKNKEKIIKNKEKILDLKSKLPLLNNKINFAMIENKLKEHFQKNELNLNKHEIDLKNQLNELSYNLKKSQRKYSFLNKSGVILF